MARLITAPEPLIPISVLLDPVVRYAFVANALGWGSIVALNIFLPSYLQTVIGLSATDAGLYLMVLMVTLNISAGLAGQILGRVIHYKTLPMIGLVVTIAAVAILGWRAANLRPVVVRAAADPDRQPDSGRCRRWRRWRCRIRSSATSSASRWGR